MQIVEGKDAAVAMFRERARGVSPEVSRSVAEIIAAVRSGGDAALRELGERFDGVAIDSLVVAGEEFDAALEAVPDDLIRAMEKAAGRIEEFYREQPRGGFSFSKGGVLLGQLVLPLTRVGCYVPGGTAPLFSTLLMTSIPAKVAGVEEVVVATPPRRDGSVAPELLVAARLAGVATVYRIGGAQAIAALAFGTESVGAVDKIVGPGNRFVIAAKREVFGSVGIEALPGPTETLVLADESARPEHLAADLLAQAEHLDAQPVLVCTSRGLLERVEAALERELADLPTAAAARDSLTARGVAVLVEDLQEGIEVANVYAPEHLCLLVDEPDLLLPLVRNAGGVFLGHASMEALGDYILGPSHVMPTGGTARFSSALNLGDFLKVIPVARVESEALEELGSAGALMARAEGLEAHARAIESRLVSGGRQDARGKASD